MATRFQHRLMSNIWGMVLHLAVLVMVLKLFALMAMILLAVMQAVQMARKYALENQAPVLIEAMSYRLGALTQLLMILLVIAQKKKRLSGSNTILLFALKLWIIDQGWWSEEQDKETFETLREQVLACA